MDESGIYRCFNESKIEAVRLPVLSAYLRHLNAS